MRCARRNKDNKTRDTTTTISNLETKQQINSLHGSDQTTVPLPENRIVLSMAPQGHTNYQNDRSPLRVCCYGSSNKTTKDVYIHEAYTLGQTLGTRNHVCVNGGGSTGCMGAMNQGVMDVNGKVVGVIHEMFVKYREGYANRWIEGCHDVFNQEQKNNSVEVQKTQLIIVGGEDLQERKRMLVKDADALIVLPGGPGTFDELWEMVCAKQIGLIDMPIVCVNVSGYYDSFRNMLDRAHSDKFLYKLPNELLHFESTSVKAVEYIENVLARRIKCPKNITAGKDRIFMERKPSVLERMMSSYNIPTIFQSNRDHASTSTRSGSLSLALAFLVGMSTGFLLQTTTIKRLQK